MVRGRVAVHWRYSSDGGGAGGSGSRTDGDCDWQGVEVRCHDRIMVIVATDAERRAALDSRVATMLVDPLRT